MDQGGFKKVCIYRDGLRTAIIINRNYHVTSKCSICYFTCIFFLFRFAYDDRDRHWDYHVKDGKTHINWEEYVEKSYGMIEGI